MKNESCKIPDVPEHIIDEYFQAKCLYKKEHVEIPFDTIRTAFLNPLFFDVPDRGPLLGSYVIVEAGPIRTLSGTALHFPRRIARVVAHCHDRVVVSYDGTEYYVGWIEPDDYTPVGFIFDEHTTMN